jgi:hypothetical protein
MRFGFMRFAVTAAVVCALVPAAASAAGGVPGGGGAARPICGGGGGANAGGCTTVTNAANFTLNASIVPVYPFETFDVRGDARYQVKDGRTTLVLSVKGLTAFAGQKLEVMVGQQVPAEVVVSPTGTIDWSMDSSLGDTVPPVAVLTEILLWHPDFLGRVGGGVFH